MASGVLDVVVELLVVAQADVVVLLQSSRLSLSSYEAPYETCSFHSPSLNDLLLFAHCAHWAASRMIVPLTESERLDRRQHTSRFEDVRSPSPPRGGGRTSATRRRLLLLLEDVALGRGHRALARSSRAAR